MKTTMRFALLWALAGTASSCGPLEDVDGGVCDPACNAGFVCSDGRCIASFNNGANNGANNGVVAGGTWTFLYYLHADNNLEPAALEDLAEMAEIGSNDRLNIVVQVDRAEGYSEDALMNLGNFTQTKRLLVEQGNLRELDDLGEVNMDDAASVTDFIDWGLENYPADNVAFFFWDHGGFTFGFGGDEGNGHGIMNVPTIEKGIREGLAAAGRDKFTLLGFDACNMAGFEIAWLLRPYATYYLASEEFEPGHGWDHRSLGVLRQNPDATVEQIGQSFLDGFKAQAEQQGTVGEITLSLTNLSRLGALDDAVKNLAEFVKGNAAQHGGTVGRAREAALRFAKNPDPARDFHMVDIVSFAQELANQDPSFQSHADALQSAVDEAVMLNVTGPATQRARGLALYLPSRPDVYNQEYAQIAGTEAWRGMLSALFEAGGNLPAGQRPQFVNDNLIADIDTSSGQIQVGGRLAAGTAQYVAATALYYAIYDEPSGLLYILGDTAGFVDAAQDYVAAAWDGNLLVVTQGNNSAYAYASVTIEGGQYFRLSVPMVYVPAGGGEEFAMYTQLYDQNQALVQEMLYLLTDAGAGELSPAAGDQLYPLVNAVDVNSGQASWEVTSDVPFDATAGLALELSPTPSGSYVYLELDVWDIGGNQSYVYYEGEF